MLPHGAFAEYAVMEEATAMPAPAGLDHAEAAPFYVTYQTGWLALSHVPDGLRRLAAGTTTGRIVFIP